MGQTEFRTSDLLASPRRRPIVANIAEPDLNRHFLLPLHGQVLARLGLPKAPFPPERNRAHKKTFRFAPYWTVSGMQTPASTAPLNVLLVQHPANANPRPVGHP